MALATETPERAKPARVPVRTVTPPVKASRPFTVEHFRQWTDGLVLDNDKPWNLEPFQAAFVRDVFRGYQECWMVIPEGNAKTTLIGGLVLYHALFTPNARVVVAASSKDQALWLYQAAEGFVVRSGMGPKKERKAGAAREIEPDTFRCFYGYREIRVNDSQIKVFAADDRMGDGVIPTLAVLEELHRHRDLRLYRTWRGKLGKRSGQLIAISTAGHPDSEFEQTRARMKETAKKVLVRGSFTRASSETTVIHEYAVPAGKSPDNMRDVKTANPLKQITIAELQRKYESPAMTPSHWRRFVCGQPAALDTWLTSEEWDPLEADLGNVAEGDAVWVAVRVGQQGGCGIGIVAPRGESYALAIEKHEYDFPGLEFALRRLTSRYDVRMIYVDKRQFGIGADVLESKKLPLEDLPQTPPRLVEATSTFLSLVSSRNLIHDGNLELRKQVMLGQVRENTTGAYLTPSPDVQALVALMMALHEAAKHAGDRSPRIHVYKREEL